MTQTISQMDESLFQRNLLCCSIHSKTQKSTSNVWLQAAILSDCTHWKLLLVSTINYFWGIFQSFQITRWFAPRARSSWGTCIVILISIYCVIFFFPTGLFLFVTILKLHREEPAEGSTRCHSSSAICNCADVLCLVVAETSKCTMLAKGEGVDDIKKWRRFFLIQHLGWPYRRAINASQALKHLFFRKNGGIRWVWLQQHFGPKLFELLWEACDNAFDNGKTTDERLIQERRETESLLPDSSAAWRCRCDCMDSCESRWLQLLANVARSTDKDAIFPLLLHWTF